MARRAMQVVCYGPVIFEAELVAYQGGNGRRYTAQLSMAESVGQAGLGEELAALVLDAFGNTDHAEAVGLHALVDPGEEGGFVKLDLREQQDVRRFTLSFAGQTAGRGNPAGVAAHH